MTQSVWPVPPILKKGGKYDEFVQGIELQVVRSKIYFNEDHQRRQVSRIDLCDAFVHYQCGSDAVAHFKCPDWPDAEKAYYFSRCATHVGGPDWVRENGLEVVSEEEWSVASVMTR